jgi:hypothetical protein
LHRKILFEINIYLMILYHKKSYEDVFGGRGGCGEEVSFLFDFKGVDFSELLYDSTICLTDVRDGVVVVVDTEGDDTVAVGVAVIVVAVLVGGSGVMVAGVVLA